MSSQREFLNTRQRASLWNFRTLGGKADFKSFLRRNNQVTKDWESEVAGKPPTSQAKGFPLSELQFPHLKVTGNEQRWPSKILMGISCIRSLSHKAPGGPLFQAREMGNPHHSISASSTRPSWKISLIWRAFYKNWEPEIALLLFFFLVGLSRPSGFPQDKHEQKRTTGKQHLSEHQPYYLPGPRKRKETLKVGRGVGGRWQVWKFLHFRVLLFQNFKNKIKGKASTSFSIIIMTS